MQPGLYVLFTNFFYTDFSNSSKLIYVKCDSNAMLFKLFHRSITTFSEFVFHSFTFTASDVFVVFFNPKSFNFVFIFFH